MLCPTAAPSTRDAAYNQSMQLQMGWDTRDPYQYYFDRGLYFHEILPNLICGSQPRNADDVRHLALVEKVDTVLNLQQDKDMEYWGVSIGEVGRECREMGLKLHRVPARDFDPDSLRTSMPAAVQVLAQALARGERVYVHCTAGLGRSPAVCIAYMYWFRGMQLDQAYKHLTAVRPCGPKRDAIRGATYDLMTGGPRDHFPQHIAFAFSELNEDDRRNVQQRVLHARHD